MATVFVGLTVIVVIVMGFVSLSWRAENIETRLVEAMSLLSDIKDRLDNMR